MSRSTGIGQVFAASAAPGAVRGKDFLKGPGAR
jgi:hypothetical protein